MSSNIHIVDRHNGIAIQKVCPGRYNLLNDATKRVLTTDTGRVYVNIPTLTEARKLAGKPNC